MMLVPVGVGQKTFVNEGQQTLHTKVDVTETAATNLTTDAVFVTDTKVLLFISGGVVKQQKTMSYHCCHALVVVEVSRR